MTKLASVFVVDDNARDVEIITLAFEAQGTVTVTGETKSIRALSRIYTEQPDLVMLDIKMPELDGFGVLAALRGEGNLVPILMCSGSALQKDIDRAYAEGCNGYFEKPTSLAGYRSMASVIIDYWRNGELPTH